MSIFNSDLKLEAITSILKDKKASLHFAGVLGSGMYPLARLFADRGYKISGSDDGVKEDCYTDRGGIVIHKPRGSISADLVIYSLAIDGESPEIRNAKEKGIVAISRAQLLGALMSGYGTRISVSGSHGKSTTTALIDSILSGADIPHTTVSGAALSSGASYHDGGGDVFLAEACEYKDSFLRLCPSHQIITSVELDHTDYFTDTEAIRSSFLKAGKMAEVVLANADDNVAYGIAEEIRRQGSERVYTYGRDRRADYRITGVKRQGEITELAVLHNEKRMRLKTSLIGDFNLYNITAAVAIGDILGVEQGHIESAVRDFRTIDRRLSLISRIAGTPVYYDYAHHPSELSAVIGALKERFGTLTVIFRPHTYSRTKSLWNDFIAALCKADFTILLDIFPAREESIPDVSSEILAREIRGSYYSDGEDTVEAALSRPTDAILLCGAGEVDRIKQKLIEMGKNMG